MQNSISQRCWEALQTLDPNVSGSLSITLDSQDNVRAVGRISSTVMPAETLVLRALEDAGISSNPIVIVDSDRLDVVATVEGTTSTFPKVTGTRPHGWVDVLYQGTLPTASIISTSTYKRVNPETRRKIANCVAELGVFLPIVLDAELHVIDGNLRLALARQLEVEDVPVIVLGVSHEQAAFLRLVLNRSAEFQSWRHDEVGDIVDSLPNLQPLLEPLGFFGTRLLPVSYFSKNLIDYSIDDSASQQRYQQELGLEEWAQLQRERILEAERTLVEKPLLPRHTAPKLFDLPMPAEDDFLATYLPHEEIDAFVQESKEMAFKANKTYGNSDADE